MRMPKISFIGDAKLTNALGEWRSAIERIGSPKAGRGASVELTSDGAAVSANVPIEQHFYLTGSSSPYSGQQVQPASGGGWTIRPDATSITIYEDNAKTSLGGKVCLGRLDGNGVWRFHYVTKAADTGDTVILSGCTCNVPKTLTMTVTNPDANFHMFHDCTLQWGAVPPAIAPLGLGANAFLSTATFQDDFSSDYFYYHIFCSSGFYCLTRIYEVSIYGSPYLEATRYLWLSSLPGNTCTPFSLTNGRIFSGGDASTVIHLHE